jgi:hypothetical protein
MAMMKMMPMVARIIVRSTALVLLFGATRCCGGFVPGSPVRSPSKPQRTPLAEPTSGVRVLAPRTTAAVFALGSPSSDVVSTVVDGTNVLLSAVEVVQGTGDAAPGGALKSAVAHLMDPSSAHLVAAGVLATWTEPVVETVWNFTHLTNGTRTDLSSTVTFGVADSVTTGARVYLGLLAAVYVWEHFFAKLVPPSAAGTFNIVQLDGQSALAIAVTVWIALSLSTIKRLIFLQKVSGTSLG